MLPVIIALNVVFFLALLIVLLIVLKR